MRERRVAQSRLYSLDPAPLREVERWIEHYRVFRAARFQDLKQFVESPGDEGPTPQEQP